MQRYQYVRVFPSSAALRDMWAKVWVCILYRRKDKVISMPYRSSMADDISAKSQIGKGARSALSGSANERQLPFRPKGPPLWVVDRIEKDGSTA